MSDFWNGFEKRAFNLVDARKATSGMKNLFRRGLHVGPKGFRLRGPHIEGTHYFGPITTPRPTSKDLPKLKAMQESAAPLMSGQHSRIFAEGDVTKIPHLRTAFPDMKSMSSADKEMLNRSMLTHEKSEAKYIGKTKKDSDSRFFTHKDPRVILEESNMLATMPDKHKGVKDIYQNLRGMDSTKHVLETAIPGFEYGKTRLSRHAKNRVSEILKRKGMMGQQPSDVEKLIQG